MRRVAKDPVRLDVAGSVPALLVAPGEPAPHRPLLLFGHGANLGKDDETMLLLCRALADGAGAAVAILDCPEHGERRPAGLTDAESEANVSRSIADPATTEQLVEEWLAVEAAARPHAPGPVGYVGFSMGAVYGLSIVGRLPSVQAAVFALGGTLDTGIRPGMEQRNELILAGAAALEEREVLMLNMTADESFPMHGALDVFARIPGPKRMYVYEGGHRDIPPEAIGAAIHFLRRALRPRAD